MRLLVTGAGGLLGSEVVPSARRRGHEVVAAGHEELDVTSAEAVRRRLEAERPDVIVHCAAYTAVDGAEDEPERAAAVNRGGTRNVADAARGVGARLVYISSDYVFDGSKATPYAPDDPTNPLSVYGRSKREGEIAALDASRDALVVRTSWLYGTARPSFVTTMIEMAERGETPRVVDDQVGSPSRARHVAETLLDLVEHGASGVWHAVDGGSATWAELARQAIRRAGLGVEVIGITSAKRGARAPRPLYSVLDVEKTERLLGRRMRCWREALADFVHGELGRSADLSNSHTNLGGTA